MGFIHADTAVAQAVSGVSSQSVTLSGAVAAGDVICVVWASPAPDSDTISGGGYTWVLPAPGANFSKLAYVIAGAAAPSGITITTAGGGSGTRFMVADRFTPAGGTAAFGSDADTALSGTSGNLGSIAGVPAGELLWGAAHSDTPDVTWTAGASNGVNAVTGSQIGNTGGSGFSEYILSGAGGTESLTWTSNTSLTGFTSGGWEAYFTFTPSAPVISAPLQASDDKGHAVRLLVLAGWAR